MMLSPEEKAAGRMFRDDAQDRLLARHDNDPPDYTVPSFIALYRHNCPAHSDRSTALELRECYEVSPGYEVYTVDGNRLVVPADLPGELPADLAIHIHRADAVLTHVPGGRFGFIWREGRCRSCGRTARSRAGRLVDAVDRPPITGHVNR